MPAKSQTANIRDVAAAAGVSYQTVSRVLNNQPNIRESTRKRVERAMDSLGYRPSRVARALARNKSETIGFISTDNGMYGPPKTQRAIETAARDAGYFVSTVNLAAVDHDSMQSALNHLMEQDVEGLVLIAPQNEMLDSFDSVEFDKPFVTVDSAGRGGGHTIAIDQADGAAKATRHLIELGHERILHIAGPPDWLDSQARIASWQREMAAAGLPAPPPVHGDWSPRFGLEIGRQIAKDDEFTAVFVSNDQMALGLLQGLHASGRLVPDDVSVVGFDCIPESEYFWPPLTTVRPDFSELGRQCMAMLLAQLRGDQPAQTSPIPPSLVVRESTGPPRD